MKAKLYLLSMFFICLNCNSFGQIFSPQLYGFYGVATIYYPYGYFQGYVSNGVAHGTGTFYFSDGSFYRGGFVNGLYHGQGMIVCPYYGYLSGCWSNGAFAGQCYQSRYDDRSEVQRVVQQVQREMPNDSRYTSVSPEGYKITKINPDTQMGRTLLGSYSNR